MNQPQTILEYLQKNMPGYPFDPKLDGPFVEELIGDFDHINILEEAKAFRWFHDNQPAKRYLTGCWPTRTGVNNLIPGTPEAFIARQPTTIWSEPTPR